MSLGDQSRYPSNGHYPIRKVPAVNTSLGRQTSPYPPTPPSNSHERVPTTADSSASNHARNMSSRTAPRTGSSHQSPPTPVQTPPVALSPPQRFPSRMSSSVAESFKTAREEPWLSSDNISTLPDSPYLNGITEVDSEERDSGLDIKTDLDHTPTQSRVGLSSQYQQSHTVANNPHPIPNRELDTSVVRNVTIRQKPETNGVAFTEKQPESPITTSKSPSTISTSHRGPVTPPIQYVPNGVWHTPPKAYTSQPSSNNSPSRISSASTVIEAIIVTTPKQEPRALRRVSAAYSLRDAHLLGSSRSSVRVSSDSGTMSRRQRKSATAEPSLGFTYEKDPRSRATTDPGLRRMHDKDTLRDDAKVKHSNHAGSQRSSQRRVPSELSPITSPALSSFDAPLSASHIQRAISQSSSRSRTSHHSVQSATQRALENALGPAFVPFPSSTSESLVTIVQKASGTFDAHEAPAARDQPTLGQGKDENVAVGSSTAEDFLAPPSIGVKRRPSDAGSAKSRVSTDRFTMKSEDHPRYIYSQTTPFSQISAFSARDALEVGEAKTIDIYPHNNHSLLLVEQTSSKPSPPSTLRELQDGYASQPIQPKPDVLTVNIQPSTPPTQSVPFNEHVDSPLKNPRKPPLPPAINVLPATPAHDENVDPMDAAVSQGTSSIRPGLLQRARRYSDNLLSPFITRSTSLKRHNSLHRKDMQTNGSKKEEETDRHLHPDWRPRNYWETRSSDEDSDFAGDGEEDYEPLPAGGDTSEHPPLGMSILPRRMTKKLPGFRGTGGFLIGNSLGVERHGTNVRRHYINLPRSVKDRRAENGSASWHHHLTHKHSLTNLNSAAKLASVSSLRSAEAQRRRRRARRKVALHIEWIGFGGLRDRWMDRAVARKEKKAEKRREEIRRSIGPKFLIEQGMGNVGTANTS